MTSPREEMACATCLAPLNVLDDQYIHPLYRDNDGHPAVPVPTSQLDTVNRTCDFCGDPYPMWTLLGGNVRVLATSSQTGLLQDMGETWAACVPCMADLDVGRAMKVVDRAVRRMRVHDIPLAHTETNKLHPGISAPAAIRPRPAHDHRLAGPGPQPTRPSESP